jgi:hypothetical protein
MLEDKVREIFADMVVLKDPQRSEYFSNLSIPSYMRDWLVMKFSDDNGTIDYESVGRYINVIFRVGKISSNTNFKWSMVTPFNFWLGFESLLM